MDVNANKKFFLVIGSMKCGTSSINFYLGQHPNIGMASDKDLHFFSVDKVYAKGLNWYMDLFPKDKAYEIYGETSASYINYLNYSATPERILNTFGSDVKLILLARDPIERVISHYYHDFARGRISKGINEFLKSDGLKKEYLKYSNYGAQLESYLKYFKLSNILVISTEDLKYKREETLSNVFEFLGQDFDPKQINLQEEIHVSMEVRRHNAFGKLIKKTPFFWRYVNSLPFTGDKLEKQKPEKEALEMVRNAVLEDITKFKTLLNRDFTEWKTFNQVMSKIEWPEGKSFAFTIVDDTDNATVENVKPIYDLMFDLGLITTKTIWIYPPIDRFEGSSLQDPKYLKFIRDLQNKGFEIALHGIGGGDYKRPEILKGLEEFETLLGEKPRMQVNHAQNKHNIYYGIRGGSVLLQKYAGFRSPFDKFYGEQESSEYFWGDYVKEHIQYIRGRVYDDINTLKQDPKMPYQDKDKLKYSNVWYSASYGSELESFSKLISKENVDRLEAENGLCIVYTHLASGFVEDGKVNAEFEAKLRYLAAKDAWFAPTGQILDYMIEKKGLNAPNQSYFTFLDLRNILRNKLKKA